jgi:hypothetical protein
MRVPAQRGLNDKSCKITLGIILAALAKPISYAALASGIHTKVMSSSIIWLSCGNTSKSSVKPLPFDAGTSSEGSSVAYDQDRHGSSLSYRKRGFIDHRVTVVDYG